MARIRSIKPEFFTSEQIVECSTSARLMFVGLWCFCDDGGVHPASVKRLKMEVFPGDTITDDAIQLMVDELLANGLIIEFEVENERFWHVSGWDRHQKIDRPTLKYPRPDGENSTSIRRGLDEHSTTPRDGMEWNGEERKGKEEREPQAALVPFGETVEKPRPAQSKKPSRDQFDPLAGEIPENLRSSPEFLEAWKAWVQDRADRKKSITERAMKLQLKDLAAMGDARAIAAIEASIKGGWSGIFEPNQNGKSHGLNGNHKPHISSFEDELASSRKPAGVRS